MTATELPAPRFNHVAMSVPSDLLDEEHRAHLTKFYGDVFGFEEHAMLTVDRKRLVLGALRADQFLYIIANDDPMTCPRLDHWGMSVESEEQLDDLPRPGQEVPRGGSPRRHRRQARRGLQLARAQVVLRRVPAADDGRGAVLRLQGPERAGRGRLTAANASTSRRGC